ncbi:MAG: hypothetical protein ABR555_15055 [Pyrinomonadaceae bacterium]
MKLVGLTRRDLISLEELNQRAEDRTSLLRLATNLAGIVRLIFKQPVGHTARMLIVPHYHPHGFPAEIIRSLRLVIL